MRAHQVRPYGPEVSDDHAIHTTTGSPAADHDPVHQYEIRVQGHLGPRWSAWFDGLSVTDADDGTTVIRGPIVDQSALHGLLQKLRDVGIPLISLEQLRHGSPTSNERT
jgi:hypothetical protein